MIPAIPLAAVVVCLSSAGLLAAAYRFARASRAGVALACVLAAGASIQAYAASEPQLHDWDERFHAVVAKHLVQHPLKPTLYDDPVLPYDYRDWMANHIWLHKPPLPLWLIATSLRIFGTTEFAVRVPSLLLSTLAIGLTFAIGRRLFDARVALLAAAFHAVNGLLVALASGSAPIDHVDTLLIVLVEVGALLAIVEMDHARLATGVALGLTVGFAALTKWYPASLVLLPWTYLSIRHPSRRVAVQGVIIVAVAAFVIVPWAWYIFRAFPREAAWEWRYGLMHSTVQLEEHHSGPLFFLADMPKFFGELVYVPLVWAAIAALKRSHPGLQLAWVWIAVPYTAFSFAATKGSAYVMVAAPAVFLIEAWFWCEIAMSPTLARRRAWRAVLLLAFGLLPSRYLLRPGGPFTVAHTRPQWVTAMHVARDRVVAPRPVLFNVPHPIDTMFYLPWPAYAQMPTSEQAAMLRSRGYSVLVYDRSSDVLRGFDARSSSAFLRPASP